MNQSTGFFVFDFFQTFGLDPVCVSEKMVGK